MKRVGIICNVDKPDAPEILARLTAKAAACDLSLVVCDDMAMLLPDAERVAPEAFGAAVDVLLALGGDGTLLRGVRLLGGADIPVLGVNLGSLGFMTSVTEEALEHALDVLVNRTYVISRRSLLACRLQRSGEADVSYTALNDVVVGWGGSSRAMVLGLAIDGEEVAQYLCDGLIVSTPTGSTGHSLSAGGPIVHPSAPVLTVNVICPHTLGARPLVLADSSDITVYVLDMPETKQPLLSIDGQGEHVLRRGDALHITRSPHTVPFMHLPEYSYFGVLRQKLHWRGSARG